MININILKSESKIFRAFFCMSAVTRNMVGRKLHRAPYLTYVVSVLLIANALLGAGPV